MRAFSHTINSDSSLKNNSRFSIRNSLAMIKRRQPHRTLFVDIRNFLGGCIEDSLRSL